MTHDEKVRRIQEQIRARQSGAPLALHKSAISHFVPNPGDPRKRAPRIDVRGLDAVLSIDPLAGICVAEPGVSFETLVRATLAHGLIPMTVPELKGITIGGAISGCSIESMSYRYGGFHDSCLEYEMITGTGEVLTCSPDTNADIFHMLHGSYGTLGIITKIAFRLIPAKPFVRMSYVRFRSFDAFWGFVQERMRRGDHDFIDAILHGPEHLTVCLGTMVDVAPRTSRFDREAIFYRSTAERSEDWLATFDYLFRYDAECHWLTNTIPPLTWKPVRRTVGRWFLGSTNLIRWSKRLEPVMKFKRRPDVIVDVFIPEQRFGAFFDWYARDYRFWPLWIVPYRAPAPYPWIADDYARGMGDGLFIDCAVYGKKNTDPGVDWSEVLEKKTIELGGIKTLISRNHFDEKTFWTVYSRPRWQAVKERTDPTGLFGDLYRKFHPGQG